jgi:hypothetical protein
MTFIRANGVNEDDVTMHDPLILDSVILIIQYHYNEHLSCLYYQLYEIYYFGPQWHNLHTNFMKVHSSV